MAIVKQNAEVRGKLVFSVVGDDGASRQVSRTFSNLAAGVTDDVLYAGMGAMAPLFASTPSAMMRVDEAALIEG